MKKRIKHLIEEAEKVRGVFQLADEDYDAGSVGAALITKQGNIYSGICIDMACGIGFCAEHAAIADMLKHREKEIEMIVAVGKRGIYPPCGRCREMMMQISKSNKDTLVVIKEEETKKLSELLPHYWDE